MIGTATADDWEHPGKPTGTFAWGSDGTDDWEVLDVAAPQKTDHHSHRPFYHIAPSGGERSPHFFGLLDNFPPSSGGGRYTANWHVHMILDKNADPLPGQPPFIEGGPATFENPTVSKIDEAIEEENNISKFDFGFEFICPVRQHNPGNS